MKIASRWHFTVLLLLACIVSNVYSKGSVVWAQTSEESTVAVTTTAASGAGSLVSAIDFANAHPNTTITFAVPKTDAGYQGGVWSFLLPAHATRTLSAPMVLDGATQTQFAGDTNTDGPEILISDIYPVFDVVTIKSASVRDVSNVHVNGLLDFVSARFIAQEYAPSSWAGIQGQVVLDAQSSAFFAAGSRTLINGGFLSNHGTVVMQNATIQVQNAPDRQVNTALMENFGQWLMEDNASVASSNGIGRFVNRGTVKKGSGSSYSSFILPFDNSGTVECQQGFLLVSQGGQHTGLLKTVNDARILISSGLTPATMKNGVRLEGNIELFQSRLEGQITVAGTTQLHGGMNAATTVLPEARLLGTGKVEWVSGPLRGTLNLPANSVPFVWIAGDAGILEGIINNAGTFQIKSIDSRTALMRADASNPTRFGTINNSGLCIIYARTFVLGDEGCVFNNSGTVESRLGDSSQNSASLHVRLNNSGTIHAKESHFNTDGGINTGVLKASAPYFLSYSLSKARRANLQTGTRIQGNVFIAYSQLDGDVVVSGTNYVGDLASANYPPVRPDDTLIGTSTGKFSGNGTLVWGTGGISGVVNFAPDNAPMLLWQGGILRGRLNVPRGGVVKVGPLGEAFPQMNYIDPFTTVSNGSISNAGMVEILPGGKLEKGSEPYIQKTGETRVNGTVVGNLGLSGGVLSGKGKVVGNVYSRGTVSPNGDAIGILTIDGNYTQTDEGKLLVDLAATESGRFDVLKVTGKAVLAGTVDARAKLRLFPTDTFKVLEYAAVTGVPANTSPPFESVVNMNYLLLRIDADSMGVRFEQPSDGSVISTLPIVYGLANGAATADKGGKVLFTLRRLGDNTFWNGSRWQSESVGLKTTFSENSVRWRITKLLPDDTQLEDGEYYMFAYPFDSAGHRGVPATAKFSVLRSAAATESSSSSVVLSSVSADSVGKIRLTFTGALNQGVGTYDVTVDGTEMEVQSTQSANASTVELITEILEPRAKLRIAYSVMDAQGKPIIGTASVVVK